MLSMATTDVPGQPRHVRDGASERRTQVSAVDISRAYFNASTEGADPTYVALPPEDPDHGVMCGLLKKHMYGTRRAAEGWQDEYSGSLVEIGFMQGAASPCVFSHASRGIVVSVHGDDFTLLGDERELDWFTGYIKERFEVKSWSR